MLLIYKYTINFNLKNYLKYFLKAEKKVKLEGITQIMQLCIYLIV